MKKEKTANNRGIVSLGLVFVAILLVTGLVVYFGQRSQNAKTPETKISNSVPRATTTPTPLPKVEDEVKDGVYTNYTYGFRFEYDVTELEYDASSDYGAFWKYKNKELGGGYLGVIFSSPLESELQEIYSVSEGKTFPLRHEIYTVLEKKETEMYRLASAHIVTESDAQTDHIVGYEAVVYLKNKKELFLISLLYVPERVDSELLKKKKPFYDQVIDTFEVF